LTSDIHRTNHFERVSSMALNGHPTSGSPTSLHPNATARVALVHDYLLVLRGAERTFAAMADVWPDAPIVTLLYDEAGTQQRFADKVVTTSGLQRLRVRQTGFRRLLPFFPAAVKRLRLDGFDAIVSSSSAFAHGVRKPPGARHLCYCHSPFRYAWHERSFALAEVPAPLRPPLDVLMRLHRGFDRRASLDVDQYVANSKLTRDRIRRFWGRDAPVVHPPVDVERFAIGQPEDYVLFVGELVRHKRPAVAIEAATAAGRRLKVVGSGPELGRLRARYDHQAEFLGKVSDEQLAQLYAGALALIVPKVEEFGVAAVEAQAAGRPVVGLDAGGLAETVIHDRTGLLVPPGDESAMVRALREDLTRFDPEDIRAHAQRFSRRAFQSRIRELVEATCE
jgi:glycosyltransferase involved in cell wall biosynthesis